MAVEYTFESFDGIKLFGKIDAVSQPSAAIVIVHGLCEHQGRYDYLAARLNAQGYSVYRFDHRGHGRSEGKPVFYSSYEEIAKDVDAVVDRAIADNPEAPVFIIGHSMGGFAAALYGHLYPNKVDGYVLSGAWTRDNKGMAASLKEGEAALAPDDFYFPNALGDGVCSDPSVVEAYMQDPYVAKEISIGLMRAISKGHDFMRDNPDLFEDPVLILHGGDDGLVSPKDSLQFYDEIAAWDKSLHIYAGLYHEIFNEYDKDTVIQEVLDWLNVRSELVYEYFDEEIDDDDDDEDDED